MKKFSFRLDPVIRYRQYRQRLALMELARTKRALMEARDRVGRIEAEKAQITHQLDLEQRQGIDIMWYRTYTAYLTRLQQDIDSGYERAEAIAREMAEKHHQAETQRVEKEILERAREKARAAYLQDMIKSEQKTIDELVSVKRPNRVPEAEV